MTVVLRDVLLRDCAGLRLMEENMLDAGGRPMGRLCYWVAITACSFVLAAFAGAAQGQTGPATTTVADTVYMADGTAAQGSLIISWPAFVTASGAVVGAGTTSVTLGAHGSLSVALVANSGATPSGMYYTVVYQLGPGQVRTEQWIVPATSPASLAAVRTTPGSGLAGPAVSMEYVNSELATKANDNAVVHVSGTETITGTKTFAVAPTAPTPTSATQMATKAYVDSAVSNVGAGNYLSTAGGTVSGPITLPSDPVAALQASTKQYVDSGLGSKADLVSGVVPASELGTGQATAGNCLQGNGTWAPCAEGGSGNLSTTPSASQTIAQPVGTQFAANNLANIRYVTASWNWLQTPADNLTTAGNVTIHLSPCPPGMDTTSSANYYSYKVYIAGKGTAEAVPVTGGSCAPGASSGTITVTTAYSHAAGYTVGSASSGIQEAWNDAWTSDVPHDATSLTAPYVKLVADTTYSVYAAVYLRGRGGILDGAGALVACSTRDRCIYIGTTQADPQVHHHKLYNLTGTSTVNVDGVQVASVSAASGTYSITTASNHPFAAGDVVDCEYYSQTATQHWVSTVKSVSGATSFTVAFGNSTFAAGANTFGFCNILNTFIENNSDHVALQDVNLTQVGGIGMGYFSYGIVNDNDQQFIVERAANRSSLVLKSSANWPLGAFLYERTDQGNAGITYIHSSEFTNINCATAGGNGFVMSDTVCQGFPVYGVRYFGGYQPATFANVYQESTGGSTNPLYGIAAQMGYAVQGGLGTRFVGTFPTSGYWPVFASGGTNERNYFVVPRSSTQGYGPLMFAGYALPATSGTNVTVTWPSIALQDGKYDQSLGTVTWDVLMVGQSGTTPYGTGVYALATNAAVACGTNGMCSFTDTQNAPTTYTVQGQQFLPVVWFWPTGVVLNNTTVFTDVAGFDPTVVASQGTSSVAIVAEQCVPGGMARRRNPVWVSCLASAVNGGSGFVGTVLQQQDQGGNGPYANSKGRLNFGRPIGTPNDLITLADSNFTKTVASWGERPANDAGDMAIGMDQTGGLSERAATSISSYVDVVPSGTNFLERLTAGGKTFNVPVTVNGALNVSGNVTLPLTGSGFQCLHVNSAGIVSGTGADCGSGGSGSGSVNTGSTTELAMYSGNGSVVSGDSVLTDNGTTLTYMGAGGIGTSTGSFSGNVTVNGQLQVAGPWMVSTPIPGTSMASAGAGTSALGISNDGNFYISANGTTPQKVATATTSSYFSNLLQEDANDIGQSNGTTGQTLHVYGTYTNASTFERAGLGWDGSDSYFVVKSENSGSGTYQRGLGFWIGSGIRWGINTASELKPFSNNSFDVGDAGYAPRTLYAGTSLDTLTQGRLNFELCNDTTTGTALNLLAKYSSALAGCAVKSGTTDADGIIGVVSNGSGTTGSAVITYRGWVQCSFDGGTTAGDYVVPSTTTAGDCHDAGATRPTGVQVLGRVESTNSGSNVYGVRISLDAPEGSGGGSMPSATEGNILVNSSAGSGTAYTPLLYEIHSSGFAAGTTLKTMLGSCPSSGTCRVILDPGATIPVGASGDYPVVIGPGYNDGTWQHVTVENRGANLQCTLTGGGSTTDCMQIGEWGALIGNNDGNGTAGGAVITSVANATYRSMVSNAGVCGNGTCGTTGGGAAGYQNYLQQRFSFEGNAIYPSGTTSLSQGLLSLIAVEGNAKVSHIALGGLSYTSNLYIADGPYSGDNNSLLFEDVIGVCNNRPGCVGLNILGSPSTGNGNGINMTFHEVGFGNTAMGSGCNSGAGCAINIDGSTKGTHNTSYVADILFDGVYIEQSGTYPAWTASTAYSVGNAILQSGTYYQVTAAGTSGASAPTWSSCTTTCTDGTVTWTNAGATNPSHFIEITNARDVDMRGINFNAGTVNNCITINHAASSYTGRIHLTGRVGSGHCTNVVSNAITGYALSGTVPADLDYTYPGEQAQAGQVVDGGRVAIGTETVGKMCFPGVTSGQACLDAAATAGSPSTWLMPTADPTSGQVLQAGAPGGGNVQLAWATPTVSASNITTGNLPAAQLPVQNWWITAATGGGTTPTLSSSTNKMKVFGVVLTYPVATTQVSYYVQTADSSANTYDLGIYDSTGTLRAHTGSTAGTTLTLASATGWKTLNWTGSATLLPGRYLLAITSSCTSSCATFLGANANGITFQGSNIDMSVTQGGLCPGSIAWPADSLNGSTAIPVWQVH